MFASIFLIVLGALFILVVWCDQIVIITNRLSVLDRVRLDQKRIWNNKVRKRGCINFMFTFGEPSIMWVIPTTLKKNVYFEYLY